MDLENLITLRDRGMSHKKFGKHIDDLREKNHGSDSAMDEVLKAAGAPKAPADKETCDKYYFLVANHAEGLYGALVDGFGMELCDFDLESALSTLMWSYDQPISGELISQLKALYREQ